MSEARHISGLQLARLLDTLPDQKPRYVALAQGIRSLVQDGRLPIGVRLPAERDLAGALGVSRTTVTAAYDALREDGFVSSRQGAGSWTSLPSLGGKAGSAPSSFTARPVESGTIDLGCASMPAPSLFAECVQAAVEKLPAYAASPGYDPAGLLCLREAVAARYTERGLPTRPEEIVITTGGQHACSLLLQTLVADGDAVMVERPTYPHVLTALRNLGARVVPVGIREGWDDDLICDGLRQSGAGLAYLIPDFQNPTGHLMGEASRIAVVEAARFSRAQIIADETFAELALDGPPAPPLASFDTGGRVISVGSASKLFWGGLRIGWIRANVPLARRLCTAREPIDIASPVLDQLIVTELMGRIEEVRAERVAALTASREALVDALRTRLPDWCFTVPKGGMSLWARMPVPVASALSEAALRRGVRIVAGPVFGADGVLEDYVRIPFVKPPEELREAVERLACAYEGAETEVSFPVRRLPAYV